MHVLTAALLLCCLDESDLKIVCGIIEAAIWYTIAEKVEVLAPPLES
jgi:hypothetical protein